MKPGSELIFRPQLSDMLDLDGETCRIVEHLSNAMYLIEFPSGLRRAAYGEELIIPHPQGR